MCIARIVLVEPKLKFKNFESFIFGLMLFDIYGLQNIWAFSKVKQVH